MLLVLNVPFVHAVSYRLQIFTTVASMCLFPNKNKLYKHKFWGIKYIYQLTCPPTIYTTESSALTMKGIIWKNMILV